MPVLNTERSTKKVILPSSSTPTDEAWVEIYETSIAGDLVSLVGLEKEPSKATIQAITNLIKDWNFTDAKGEKVPVSVDSVKYLPLDDLIAIVNETKIFEGFSKLSDTKKKT